MNDKTIVFLDTEFMSFEAPYLLSIGCVVNNSDESFYFEVSDPENSHMCSEFVKKHVLCHLEGGEHAKTSLDGFNSFNYWISSLAGGTDRKIILVSDSPSYDAHTLALWKSRHEKEWSPSITPMSLQKLLYNRLNSLEFSSSRNYREHHALDDAKRNRDFFNYLDGKIHDYKYFLVE